MVRISRRDFRALESRRRAAATGQVPPAARWFGIKVEGCCARATFPVPPSVNLLFGAAHHVRRAIGRRTFNDYKQRVQGFGLEARAPLAKLKPEPLKNLVVLLRPDGALDIDNALKVLLDACQGVLWDNDRWVKRLFVDSAADPADPRVELIVHPYSDVSGFLHSIHSVVGVAS